LESGLLKTRKKWITECIKLHHLQDNLLFDEETRALHTHSADNAPQHFKITGAMEAYAALWYVNGTSSLNTIVQGAQTSSQNLPGLQT
jgi:hypothetical protein